MPHYSMNFLNYGDCFSDIERSGYGGYSGYNLLENPELLCKPVGAIRSSMWVWWKKGLNELADKDDFATITRRINGGTNGWDDRKKYLGRAQKELYK